MSIYDRVIEIALGRRRDDMHWVNQRLTVEALGEKYFTGFQRGPKEGACMLSGSVVAPRRLKNNMAKNALVLLDHDTGETMDEIAAAIEPHGLFSVLWHTHSHLKTTSDVGEGGLVNFLKRAPEFSSQGYTTPDTDETVLLEQLRAYFLAEKGLKDEIVESIYSAQREHADGGVRYTVEHAPLHRLRSLFVLDEDYSFTAGVQKDRLNEWSERYGGFCVHKLGVKYDRSCADPSRLMYVPRIARDADENRYEIRVIDGRALTLDDMPRLNPKARSHETDAFTNAARELGTSLDDTKDAQAFVTKNVRKFAAQGGSSFAAAECARTRTPENVRGERGTKLTYRCPNDDNHSNPGDPNDQGFWIENAQDREGSGFMMSCSHDTCKGMSGGDRLFFLDKFCQENGIDDAMELKEWCDDWKESNEEVREAQASENETAWCKALSDLPEAPSPDDLLVLVRLIAAGPNGLYEDARLDAIVEKVGKQRARRVTLTKEIKKERERLAVERARSAAGGGNPLPDPRPVPEDKSRAGSIYDTWGYYDKIECARARFVHVNEQDPQMFRRPEGGVVRLQNVGDVMLFEAVTQRPQWTHELAKRMEFIVVTGEGEEAHEEPDEPFAAVVNEFMGANDFPLPVVERIVEVPVFGEDGSLRTEKGYDASSKTYLNPSIKFIDVPEIIDETHVQMANMLLLEATRDFPFSDSFTGRDDKPVRLKNEDGSWADVDDDGHAWPNFERGQSSRANFYSMVLQPFARSMITGPCPAYLIDKSMPGTGAGFLADVAGMILNGARMVPQTIPGDGDEFRKEMASVLREGATTVFFDNMTIKTDSGALASALTAGVWKSRILGQSATVSIPIKATWIFAANNGRFSDELMRRIVPIRMDAATANPARDRGGDWYKHSDLHAWLEENRANLVWACHVLIKNWVQQGRPAPSSGVTLQSFNSWATTMGGILEAAGLHGFLENIGAYLEGREEDAATETPLITRLWMQSQNAWLRVDEVLDACRNKLSGEIEPGLGIDLDMRNDNAMQRSLGFAMGRVVGKVYRIETSPGLTQLVQVEKKTSNGARYRVALVE